MGRIHINLAGLRQLEYQHSDDDAVTDDLIVPAILDLRNNIREAVETLCDDTGWTYQETGQGYCFYPPDNG